MKISIILEKYIASHLTKIYIFIFDPFNNILIYIKLILNYYIYKANKKNYYIGIQLKIHKTTKLVVIVSLTKEEFY